MPKEFDPSVIDNSPISPDEAPGSEEVWMRLVAELSSEVADTKAELDQLRAKKSFDEVVAEMLQPYSERVFRFVAYYCGAVGIFLLLSGFKKCTGFELSDTVLGIISGSTAVSVIGLIGMVITGLFGAKSLKAAKAQQAKRQK